MTMDRPGSRRVFLGVVVQGLVSPSQADYRAAFLTVRHCQEQLCRSFVKRQATSFDTSFSSEPRHTAATFFLRPEGCYGDCKI